MFPGDEAACGDRCAVEVDGCFGGFDNLGVAGKSEVVVAGIVDVLAAADLGGRARNSLVQFEERVADAQPGRAIIDDANLLVTRMQIVGKKSVRKKFGTNCCNLLHIQKV